MALSLIVDPNETPESARRKRKIAEALMGQLGQTPTTYGGGIQALLTGFAANMANKKADAADAYGARMAQGTMDNIRSAYGNQFPAAPGSSFSTGGENGAIAGDMPAHRRALLNTISGPESGGDYNVIYGGGQFDDFSDHPRRAIPITSGPNKGKTSSAAGKYQFLGPTWDQYRDKLGLKDFSPASQDAAAWELASDTYRGATGEDLDQVLQSGDPRAIANVGKVLNGVWTSLPGGIEQGTNTDRFLSAFQRNLAGGAGQDRVAGGVGNDPMGGVQGLYDRTAPYSPSHDPAMNMQVQDRPMNYRTLSTQNVPPTDAGLQNPKFQAVVQALMNGQSMGGAPQRFQQPNASPAVQKIAQALLPRQTVQQPVQVAQAQGLPEMAGNQTVSRDAMGGPSMQMLMEAAQNPWLNENDRSMVNTLIDQQMRRQQAEYQRQQQLASPEYQLDMRTKQAQLDKLNREAGSDAEFKVVGNQLLRIGRDGQISDVTPQGGGGAPGQFRFEGNSVEAQALNGLMDSGALTPDQAQQLAAGKTILGPNGETLFLTPRGIFGQEANGGPPQPVQPQQSRLFSPNSMGGPQMAPGMPQPPQGGPQTLPQQQGQPMPQQRPGVIPVTQPKPIKATEKQRNDEARVNSAFTAINTELDRYAQLVGKTGISVLPGKEKDQLNTVRQGVMLQLKELFNLGVLNGPDLSLMERMIYDPTVDVTKEGGAANLPDQVWTGITGNAGSRADSSVAELKRMLTNIRSSVVGSGDTGGWNDAGGGVRIRRKD